MKIVVVGTGFVGLSSAIFSSEFLRECRALYDTFTPRASALASIQCGLRPSLAY